LGRAVRAHFVHSPLLISAASQWASSARCICLRVSISASNSLNQLLRLLWSEAQRLGFTCFSRGGNQVPARVDCCKNSLVRPGVALFASFQLHPAMAVAKAAFASALPGPFSAAIVCGS